MRTQVAARLARIENSSGVASKRLVVVEARDVGTAEEFLQSHDVDMSRVVLVITGVVRSETEREKRAYWLRAARGMQRAPSSIN